MTCKRRGALRSTVSAAAVLLAFAPRLATAGPPYLTDDPQPTDRGRWEIYNFVGGARGPGGLGGEAGLDINYGAAPDLQLTAVVPVGYQNPQGFGFGRLRFGPADLELAAKYKLVHQAEGSWTPDVSVFPRVYVPTAPRDLDTGRTRLFLPLWAQKDWGAWQVFGGGGWELNPGPGQRNFWQGGLALNRTLNARAFVGAEVYGQTNNADDGGGYLAFDVGGGYKVTDQWSLIGTVGPAWQRADGRDHGGAVFYFAAEAQY